MRVSRGLQTSDEVKWLIASLLFLLIFQPINLEKWLMPWVINAHEMCNQLSPQSEHRSWYRAIVCGQNLPPSVQKTWFQQTGLIHVIVVSGSHLLFLEEGLIFFRAPLWLRWIILILFSAMSALQPPIARALIQKILAWQFAAHHLPQFHLQLFAAVVTLALFPTWWTSLSFIMSALCTLALSLPLPSRHPLARATLIYLLMVPPVIHFQSPHPSSILFNVLMAPVLGSVLFPVSLLGFLHPWIANVSDQAWNLLFFLLSELPLPKSEAGFHFSFAWLIIFHLLSQGGALVWLIHWRRKFWKKLSSSS